METILPVLFIGVIVFLAHLFKAIFTWTRLPDVLLLIGVGVLLGPATGWVVPAHFGAVGTVLSTVTLVLILFEGGLDLDLAALAGSLRGALSLTLVHTLLSVAGVAVLMAVLAGFHWPAALLLGAIVCSISPAVVVPIVRGLPMGDKTRTILFLESAVSDVGSIVLTVGILEALKLGRLRIGAMAIQMGGVFLFSILAGVLAGVLWSFLLQRIRTLQHAMFLTPAFVFIVFGVVDLVHLSGYLAALAFGVVLGNVEHVHARFLSRLLPRAPIAHTEEEKVFFGEIVFLLKTFFFLFIGISLDITDLYAAVLGLGATGLIFLVRLPAVGLTAGRLVPPGEAAVMAVMTPKGLAAAVLASLPIRNGLPDGDLFGKIAYIVIVASILGTALGVFLVSSTPVGRLYAWLLSGKRPPSPGPQ